MAENKGDYPSDDLHMRQHVLIEDRLSVMRDEDTYLRRRRAGQRVGATLAGHMRRFHGWTGNAALLTLDELLTKHNAEHNESCPPC